MTTTLVTGGNGFIGRYLVRSLLESGREVLVADWHGQTPENGANLILIDMRDAGAVTEAMAHADSYIHLAGVLGTAETIKNPRPAAEVNILGGLNVLEAASQYNLPGVVIAVGNHWMNNTYSITKTTVERFCSMFRDERGLPVTVVRALNAYGPGQSVAAPFGSSKVRKITPSFVCRALTGAPIEVYGDGGQVMDMIHVRDVAKILRIALEQTEQRGALGEVIEAGTGRDTTVAQIAHIVNTEVGGDNKIRYLPMRPGEPERSVVLADTTTLNLLDTKLFQTKAGLWTDHNPLITLEDGIAETVKWYAEYWLPEFRRTHGS